MRGNAEVLAVVREPISGSCGLSWRAPVQVSPTWKGQSRPMKMVPEKKLAGVGEVGGWIGGGPMGKPIHAAK